MNNEAEEGSQITKSKWAISGKITMKSYVFEVDESRSELCANDFSLGASVRCGLHFPNRARLVA